MSRLPIVDGDEGSWGTVLNDFLQVELNSNGTLKKQVIVQGDLSYNVLNYGATGDGVTDDAIAIQSAITAAIAGNRMVYFPSGTYLIGTTITITNKITLFGDGWTSILKAKTNLNDYVITFSPPSQGIFGTHITQLKIDGNNTNQSAGGCIMAQGAIQCLFDFLHITAPWDNGIYCFQDGALGTGHHNRIVNCLFDNGQTTNGGAGRAILFQASDENFVANCDFESNGRAATGEPNHIYDRSGLQTFVGNCFVGGQTAIKIEGGHSRIIGCMFDGNNNHSIRLNGDKNIVANNSIFKIGNNASAGAYDGVWVDNVGYNQVIGNHFYTDTSSTRSGVNLANGASNNVVSGNVFTTQGSGFVTSPIIPGAGSGNTIQTNKGFVTEASGTATIGAAVTSIDVSHGLGITPALKDISVTPTSGLGTAASFWISNPTSSQFTINVNAAPGGSGATFVWQAMIL